MDSDGVPESEQEKGEVNPWMPAEGASFAFNSHQKPEFITAELDFLTPPASSSLAEALHGIIPG